MSTTSNYYLARAQDSAREASEAILSNVRERCLRSEAAWLAMAQRLLKNEAQAAERVKGGRADDPDVIQDLMA